MNVSVRDLKNELSAYLRRVRRGERVVVTDRGRPVAEISPARGATLSLDERLERMAEEGELVLPKRRKRFALVSPTRIRGGSIAESLLEERR